MSTDASETAQKEAPQSIPVTRIHPTSDGGYISDEEFKAKEEFEKKQAEHKAARQALWEKDPDQFILVNDVIFGAINCDGGKIGILSGGHPRPVVEAAMFRMIYKAVMMFQHMDLQHMMNQKSDLIVPEGVQKNGGIIT